MRYLVGIPCLYGPDHCREAIESVVNKEDVDVLLIDNGANESVKHVLNLYAHRENVKIIRNPVNIYVNPAWNQIINHFINNDYDYLLIMNSDLILHKSWVSVLDMYLDAFPDIIPVPVISSDSRTINKNVDLSLSYTEVFEGTPGVLIVLSKEHCRWIFPIPECIKIWFGDNWIYEGLRKLGYRTLVLNNLLSYHSGSQTVSRLPGISEMIENDKREWEKLK